MREKKTKILLQKQTLSNKMTLTPKTRLAKRKLEIKEVRKENQKVTSKKHDRKCFEFSERSTKDVLLKQLRVLEEKIIQLDNEKKVTEELIGKLKAENDKHNEENKYLEEKIINLENETKTHTSQPNVVTTDSGDILMFCNECEYPAEDIYDLGEHMYEIHSSRYEGEGEVCFVCDICNDRFVTNLELSGHAEKHHREAGSIKCKFCDECHQSKTELMRHNKQVHISTVSTCWNYSLGTCVFGDQACWFKHSEPVASSNMQCKICDKIFPNKSEYHMHRKENHTVLVTPCLGAQNGNCKYEDASCWFSHDVRNQSDNAETAAKDKNEVIQRIFEIMEKMTERITELEKTDTT